MARFRTHSADRGELAGRPVDPEYANRARDSYRGEQQDERDERIPAHPFEDNGVFSEGTRAPR
jgi:hypothetical protein